MGSTLKTKWQTLGKYMLWPDKDSCAMKSQWNVKCAIHPQRALWPDDLAYGFSPWGASLHPPTLCLLRLRAFSIAFQMHCDALWPQCLAGRVIQRKALTANEPLPLWSHNVQCVMHLAAPEGNIVTSYSSECTHTSDHPGLLSGPSGMKASNWLRIKPGIG